jgi:hypothetical protein
MPIEGFEPYAPEDATKCEKCRWYPGSVLIFTHTAQREIMGRIAEDGAVTVGQRSHTSRLL